MDSKDRLAASQRNPKTHAAHRREELWQIFLPLVLGILLILAALGAIIFSAIQPVNELGRWASVSLVWLIMPALVIAFIILVIVSGLIYAVSFLMGKLPHAALVVQLFIEQVKGKAGQVLNTVAEPILRINSIWAAIRYASGRGRKPAGE
jgi:hypothetical protein